MESIFGDLKPLLRPVSLGGLALMLAGVYWINRPLAHWAFASLDCANTAFLMPSSGEFWLQISIGVTALAGGFSITLFGVKAPKQA